MGVNLVLFGTLTIRRSVAFMVLGSMAFTLYLWFFVGFDELFNLLRRINPYNYSIYYSLAILALFLSLLFDSMVWHDLLKALSVRIKLRRLLLYNWIGNFVEMVLPCETVCGEVTRIYLSQKESGENVGVAAASVVSARILNTVMTSIGLVVGSLALILSGGLSLYLISFLVFVSFGTVLAIGIVLYLALKEGSAEKFVNVLARLAKIIAKNRVNIDQQRERIQKSLSSFSQGFKLYKQHPRYLLKPLFYAFVSWFFALVVYLMVFYSLDFRNISIINLAMIYCIAVTVETVTSGLPIGAVEITMVNLYSLSGVPLAIAGAATTLTRLLTFWSQAIAGYPILNWIGAKYLTDRPTRQAKTLMRLI